LPSSLSFSSRNYSSREPRNNWRPDATPADTDVIPPDDEDLAAYHSNRVVCRPISRVVYLSAEAHQQASGYRVEYVGRRRKRNRDSCLFRGRRERSSIYRVALMIYDDWLRRAGLLNDREGISDGGSGSACLAPESVEKVLPSRHKLSGPIHDLEILWKPRAENVGVRHQLSSTSASIHAPFSAVGPAALKLSSNTLSRAIPRVRHVGQASNLPSGP